MLFHARFAIALATLFVASVSHADIVFETGTMGTPGPDPVLVAPGEAVSIGVFISETGVGEDRLSNLGLGAALIEIDPRDLSFQGAVAADAFELAPNFVTTQQFFTSDGNLRLQIATPISPTDPSLFDPVSSTDGSVLLGNINFVVPSTAKGTLFYDVESGEGTGADILLGGNVLDFSNSLSLPTLTSTVLAVPEPNSVAFLGSLVLGCCCLARRRRKR